MANDTASEETKVEKTCHIVLCVLESDIEMKPGST